MLGIYFTSSSEYFILSFEPLFKSHLLTSQPWNKLKKDLKSSITKTSERDGSFIDDVTMRDNVCSCKVGKTLNVKPCLIRIERSQLQWLGHVTKNDCNWTQTCLTTSGDILVFRIWQHQIHLTSWDYLTVCASATSVGIYSTVTLDLISGDSPSLTVHPTRAVDHLSMNQQWVLKPVEYKPNGTTNTSTKRLSSIGVFMKGFTVERSSR